MSTRPEQEPTPITMSQPSPFAEPVKYATCPHCQTRVVRDAAHICNEPAATILQCLAALLEEIQTMRGELTLIRQEIHQMQVDETALMGTIQAMSNDVAIIQSGMGNVSAHLTNGQFAAAQAEADRINGLLVPVKSSLDSLAIAFAAPATTAATDTASTTSATAAATTENASSVTETATADSTQQATA